MVARSRSQQNTALYCKGYSDQHVRCGDALAQFHYDDCMGTFGGCVAPLALPSAVEAFKACMDASRCKMDAHGYCNCDRSDDDCFAEAAKATPASEKRDEYASACRRKLDACKGDDGFSVNWCEPGDIPWQLFVGAAYDVMTPCFDRGCSDVGTCLIDELSKLSPACKSTD